MSRVTLVANAGFVACVFLVAFMVGKYWRVDSGVENLAFALAMGATVGVGAFGRNRLIKRATSNQP